MAAEVRETGASLEVGRVQPLVGGIRATLSGPIPYDVAPGGQRFLVDVQPDRPMAEPLTVVQNWAAGLKREGRL